MKRTLKTWMVAAIFLTLAGFVTISAVLLRSAIQELPSVDELGQYVPPLVTNVTDIHGLSVGEFFTERRTTVPLTKIPVDIRHALIATEDTDFYDHWGI